MHAMHFMILFLVNEYVNVTPGANFALNAGNNEYDN
jgi:hypothetical protein